MHRPDQYLVSTQQRGESRVGGEASVEIGAERDHDDCAAVWIGGRAGERVCEGRALGVGAASGMQLLELVDGEEQTSAQRERVESLAKRILRSRHEHAAKLVQRPLAGTQEQPPPPLAAR